MEHSQKCARVKHCMSAGIWNRSGLRLSAAQTLPSASSFRHVEFLEVSLADFAVTILVPVFDGGRDLSVTELQVEPPEEVLDVGSARGIAPLRQELPGLEGLVVDVLELLEEGGEVNPPGLTAH